ncbi:PH domain-containing protein [Niallia sp. Krafla_26]|uniref:PH domain-containing protein n=1 Tax=Niallia sp. Krafla_26 TaxID=3064703 RepID=UPI003D176EDE
MLKKFASDALGLSDIGKIIEPHDYEKTQSDDFVRHEDDEKIYFLIMTKSDEYCFTNLALIHIDGENAVSSKRVMKRYPYSQHRMSNVLLETAGKIDLDVEIKFHLGDLRFSIDVDKKEIEKLKDLYKALLYISEKMHENTAYLQMSHDSLNKAVEVLRDSRLEGYDLSKEYTELTEYSFDWLKSSYDKYHEKDFGYVFEKYILN